MDKKVLASVNGKEITQGAVMQFLNDLGPQTAMQFQSPEGIKKVVEELINQEVLYLDAKENKMDEEEEFKEQLVKFQEGLLKQYAVNKVLSQVQAEEDEMKAYFEERKERFQKPASIDSSHILVDSEEKAKEIIEEINAGKSFEDAAKEYSTCPSKDQGGKLGESTRGKMVEEFEDVAFEMEKGEMSDVVETQFGYHIIKLHDKSEASLSTFEEVKDHVRAEVLAEKQKDAYLAKTDSLRNKYEVTNHM